MKISGFVCVRNITKLDYCAELAIKSLLPICDEVVVSDGQSDDGTFEFLVNWAKSEPKLRIVTYPWPNPHRDITWWTTWLNTTRELLQHPMMLQLDADEVLDPNAYPAILEAAQTGKSLWFERLNFWKDAQHLAPKGKVCGDQVVRFGPSDLWLPSDEPHPEGEPTLRVKAGWPPDGDRSRRIFHYGFLRKEQAMIEKVRVVNGAFFGTMDERLIKAEQQGTPWVNEIDMGGPLQTFFEPHPEIAVPWLEERGYITGNLTGKFTKERVEALGKTGYFNQSNAPACVAILPYIKPEDRGVEIGTYKGGSSLMFLDNCAYMHFIDPCLEYAENPDKGWFTEEEIFLARLKPWEGKFTFIKGFAADVVDQIPVSDFIFVDANHEYAYVKQDLELYWPKVKAGGIFCGHDYTGGHPGVTKAVDEFFAKLNLPVESHQYCWLVHKP